MPTCPTLFTSLDLDYAPGTIVTLLSAAVALDPIHRPLVSFVLDASSTDDQFNKVSEILGNYPELVNVTRIKSDTSEFKHLPTLHNSHATYCRFQIPDLVRCDKAVYIDSDFLCLKDISSLPDIAPGYLAQAAVNHTPATCDQQLAQLSPDLSNLTGPYFNAGFIGFSPRAWRENEVKKSCLEAIERYNLPQHDQSAINLVLHGRISPLEQSWNFQRPYWSRLPLDTTPRNYHYDNIKPWHEYGVEGAFQLWYTFVDHVNGFNSIAARRTSKKNISLEKSTRLTAPFKATLYTLLSKISSGQNARKRLMGAAHWKEVALKTKLHRRNQDVLKSWRSVFESIISQ